VPDWVLPSLEAALGDDLLLEQLGDGRGGEAALKPQHADEDGPRRVLAHDPGGGGAPAQGVVDEAGDPSRRKRGGFAVTPAARLSAAIEVLDDVAGRRRPAADALKDRSGETVTVHPAPPEP
jgi:hypothetical protein